MLPATTVVERVVIKSGSCALEGLGKSPQGDFRGAAKRGAGVQPGPAGARQRVGQGGAAVGPDTGGGSGSDHSQGRQSAPRRSVHEWGAKPRPPPKARAKGFAPPQGARQGKFRRAARLG